MKFTVKNFIDSKVCELAQWERGLKEIEGGVFKYDGSMPKECIDAMYKNKVEKLNNIIKYLSSLDANLVIQRDGGLSKEGEMYYRMVNS